MKILAKRQANNSNTTDMPIEKLVNKVGKYLYKSIDGSYDYTTRVGECLVRMVIYYQKPVLPDKPGGAITYSDIDEMLIEISLTSYSGKIRVNLIELDPQEQTIGHFVVTPEKLHDMVKAREIILDKITKLLNKMFEGYEFTF